MKPEATTPGEEKRSFSWGWIGWPCMVPLLYVLSAGPMLKMTEKGIISNPHPKLDIFYDPWFWAYIHTPLHKPMGIYMHLWAPSFYGKDGEPMVFASLIAFNEPLSPPDIHQLIAADDQPLRMERRGMARLGGWL